MPSEEAMQAAAEIVPTHPPVYWTQEEVAVIIDRAIQQARDEALKEAALICEYQGYSHLAHKIRALIRPFVDPPGTPHGSIDTKPEGR